MDWYNDCKLVQDGDGYIVEIYLNKDCTEFSREFLSCIKESVLSLDEQIKKLVETKFADFKINSVKLIVGSLIIASIPFAAMSGVQAVDILPNSSQRTAVLSSNFLALNTTGVVTASKLNMRSGPATSYPVMHILWMGNKVKVIGQSGYWYQIRLSDARTGWVSKAYLKVNLRQQKIDTVVATAKSLIGTPYVWGGESPSEGGFDCSGLTQYVFSQVGFKLNRISGNQANQGIYISRGSLQRGDLIFYSFNGNGIVDHVGLYIGNGEMIHSPKAGDYVKVTNITTSYWQTRFVTVRRII